MNILSFQLVIKVDLINVKMQKLFKLQIFHIFFHKNRCLIYVKTEVVRTKSVLTLECMRNRTTSYVKRNITSREKKTYYVLRKLKKDKVTNRCTLFVRFSTAIYLLSMII